MRRSKVIGGSFIKAKARRVDVKDRSDRGMERYFRGRRGEQKALKNSPRVWPALVIIENFAKAAAQWCLFSVSMISRFRGAVEAEVDRASKAYRSDIEAVEFAAKNRVRIREVERKLPIIIKRLLYTLSVMKPQIIRAGILTRLYRVTAKLTSTTEPPSSRI